MPKLSERLTTVYNHLLPKKDVWDICCDHGYLGRAAVKSAEFSHVYFVDRVPEIMENLKSQFRKSISHSETGSNTTFLCTDGEEISAPVTGTICITGVGGSTILKILNCLAAKSLLNADRLILGPHRDKIRLVESIKNYAATAHYELTSEINLMEREIEFSLFIFDKRIE